MGAKPILIETTEVFRGGEHFALVTVEVPFRDVHGLLMACVHLRDADGTAIVISRSKNADDNHQRELEWAAQNPSKG